MNNKREQQMKNKAAYRIKGQERAILEQTATAIEHLSNKHNTILQFIAEREGLSEVDYRDGAFYTPLPVEDK